MQTTQPIRSSEKKQKRKTTQKSIRTDISRGQRSLQTDSTDGILLQMFGTSTPSADVIILSEVLPPPAINLLTADQPQARIQKLILDEAAEAGILKQRALLRRRR